MPWWKKEQPAPEVTLAESGAATARGGYANSGVHIGDVNLLTGAPVRSRYLQQVQRLAPPELFDRDAELTELVEFCTSPKTAGTYRWWRAKAWSGKSALMSWFVLHPPDGVQIVSFFITARLASQNDRVAYVENLMEQLLTLLGEGPPTFLTESNREAHLLGLLTEVAEACRRRGEHFVLVVDGLDEDRGVHDGSDSHSIAALLPVTPPAGMRVIVSGRPNPPIPADVPAHHPLCDDSIVRSLAPSSWAQAIRQEMERDLKRLMYGTVEQQELLGLVAAAGGGLSAADLAELTGESRWQIHEQLRTVTGRSFSVRDSHFRPDGPDVYLLGHEELQVTALEMLGPARLDGYRQRLRSWAEGYRTQHWPPNTPEYLLRGYFRMLTATRDLARMVLCATDPARPDRMLDLSGGDAAALSEIRTTEAAIFAQARPDLIAMVRLVIHRDRLTDRNRSIPSELPAVRAAVGQIHRAESIANSVSALDRRVEALVSVARVVAEAGDLDRAEQIAHTITSPDGQARVLRAVARAAAKAGDLDRAEQVAHAITYPDWQEDVLGAVARAAAEAGDLDRAEQIAHTITNRNWQAEVLGAVVRAAAKAGDLRRVARLLDDTEQIAHTITDRYRQAEALEVVVRAAAEAGDLDRAEQVAHTVTGPHGQAKALEVVARAAAKAGNLDRAEQIAHTITNLSEQEEELEVAARAPAKAGNLDRTEQSTHTITTSVVRLVEALELVATATAEAGDLDRAEQIAHTLTSRHGQARVLGAVATAAAEAGNLDRAARLLDDAEQVARTITPHDDALALESVARAAAKAGDLDRAEQIAHTITDAHPYVNLQTEVLGAVARAAAEAGDLDRAEQIAHTITGPHGQERVRGAADSGAAEALVFVARAAVEANDLGRAARLLDDAEQVARTITPPGMAQALEAVARAAAKAGDLDGAEQVARTITDHDLRAQVVAYVAWKAASAGDVDRAEQIARTITHPAWQSKALWAVAATAAEAGNLDRAEQIARTITPPDNARALGAVATAAAEAGNLRRAAQLLDDAEQIARTITEPVSQAKALEAVARAAAHAGNLDRAEQIAHTIAGPHRPAEALRDVATAAAEAGDLDRAEQIARTIAEPVSQAKALEAVARAAAEAGNLDRAEQIAHTLTGPHRPAAEALRDVATAAAHAGNLDRAEQIAYTITDSIHRTEALVSAARAATKVVGDFRRAARLLDDAEQIAHGAMDGHRINGAMVALTQGPLVEHKLRAVVDLLKYMKWYIYLDALIELEPAILAVIMTELGVAHRPDTL